MSRKRVSVDGKKLQLSNLEKVLYPATGFTKAQVLDYYRRVAGAMLPHLQDRPVTLKRYPDGVEADSFYEKRCPEHRPDWMETVEVARRSGGHIAHCMINDRASLMWAQNMAALELHVYLMQKGSLDRPDFVVFDLDPGAPADRIDAARVAIELRGMLQGVGLESFAKTSGGKGVHLYVPLNTPTSFDRTKSFARLVARTFEKNSPERVVSKMAKELRTGKVLIDWSQNDARKTTVCAYSMRAEPEPTVSTPLSWEEVAEAVEADDADALVFGPEEVPRRIEEMGDPFAPVLSLRQELPGEKEEKQAKADSAADVLSKYRQKRNFGVTPEPSGRRGHSGEEPVFVIQKHDASRLHYDFRLEVEGVLKSWAVPKGPSTKSSVKRLAVATEDHPMDYADFEGIIPADEYGGGAVIVWDRGTYRNESTESGKGVSMERALERGKVEIVLAGQKMRGGYVLVRTGKGKGDRENWLLIKRKDQYTGGPEPVEQQPQSVLSGRTIEDLKAAEE